MMVATLTLVTPRDGSKHTAPWGKIARQRERVISALVIQLVLLSHTHGCGCRMETLTSSLPTGTEIYGTVTE